MKALLKTVVNLAYPDLKEPAPVWQRGDYVAMIVVCTIIHRLDYWIPVAMKTIIRTGIRVTS